MLITCHRIGFPPISTRALGIEWACSWRRVPLPPHRITTLPTPRIGREYEGNLGSASGDRGQHRDLVPVAHLGGEPVLEPDVLARHVDVDEPAQVAVLGDALAQVPVEREDLLERVTHRRALDLELALSIGHVAELGGDLHGDCHRGNPTWSPPPTRAAPRGSRMIRARAGSRASRTRPGS